MKRKTKLALLAAVFIGIFQATATPKKPKLAFVGKLVSKEHLPKNQRGSRIGLHQQRQDVGRVVKLLPNRPVEVNH